MSRVAGTVGFLSIALVAGLASVPAHAQVTRTWVSGVGDDANPCTRTAPCKNFAGAISKTAAGGIINCLDPGGFGAITITKAITIDCLATQASILVSGTNAININAGAADNITIRGLSIDGAGTGVVGINYINGGTVHVERSRISGFRNSTATGILFNVPTGVGAELFVSDTTIVDNGTGPSTGGGVVIKAAGTASARIVLNRVQLTNNSIGLRTDGTAGTSGGAIIVTIRDSISIGNNGIGINIVGGMGATMTAVVDDVSTIANATGLNADGALARVLITRLTSIGNATGIATANGGLITSYLDNHINNNLVSNGTPSNTQTPE